VPEFSPKMDSGGSKNRLIIPNDRGHSMRKTLPLKSIICCKSVRTSLLSDIVCAAVDNLLNLERTYPSDTLLKDLARIRENFPDNLTSIPYLLKYSMERPNARTTPTVDVISERCRNELSKTIELINDFGIEIVDQFYGL
jgi:hypothetical protein